MTTEIAELITGGGAPREGIHKEAMREPPPVATHRSAVAHAATTGAHKSARASMSVRSGAEEAHEGAHERDANRPAGQRTCRSAAARSAPWGAARRAPRLLPHGATSATPAPLLRQSSTARPRRVPRAAVPVALHDVRARTAESAIRRHASHSPPTARRGVHRGPPRPPPATASATRHGAHHPPRRPPSAGRPPQGIRGSPLCAESARKRASRVGPPPPRPDAGARP